MAYFKSGTLIESSAVTTTAGSTTVLVVTSKKYQIFTGSSNQTLQLPDATTLANGQQFVIQNASNGVITVKLNDTSTTLVTVASAASEVLYLQSNGSSNGTWQVLTSLGVNNVDNTNLAQVAAHTYKGNNTGSTANAADITTTQLTADLNTFTSSLQGLVPPSGGGTSNYLRADGNWSALSAPSQVVLAGTAQTIIVGNIIYIKSTDGKAYLAKADTTSNCPGFMYYVSDVSGSNITLSDIGFKSTLLLQSGDSYANSAALYLSSTTAGTVTVTAPSTTGNVVYLMGYMGSTASQWEFFPRRMVNL